MYILCSCYCMHMLTGMYHKVKEDVLPQIMDWTFLLLLGIAMALLSFILDYLIEKAGEGELEHYLCMIFYC